MSSKDYSERPSGMVCKKDLVGVSFKVESGAQMELFVGGGGLHGYF